MAKHFGLILRAPVGVPTFKRGTPGQRRELPVNDHCLFLILKRSGRATNKLLEPIQLDCTHPVSPQVLSLSLIHI